METVLTLELNTDLDDLIEIVPSEMRYHSIVFQKELNNKKVTTNIN